MASKTNFNFFSLSREIIIVIRLDGIKLGIDFMINIEYDLWD